MLCRDCKETFEESLAGIHIEQHPYGETYASEGWVCCPYCGSIDITEAVQCPICGKWHEEGHVFCAECRTKAYTVDALENFLTDGKKWLEFLSWYFDDLAKLHLLRREYNRLKEFDESRLQDLTEFCESEGGIVDFLINQYNTNHKEDKRIWQ